MQSLSELITEAFSRDIRTMMEVNFNERISILQDPETGETTLHKVDGTEITEAEFYALAYFELGWTAALRSFETMGNAYAVDKWLTDRYPESLDENTTEEGTDDSDKSDTGRDD